MQALDRLIPRPRLLERDYVDLAAQPDTVWQIARHLDLGRSAFVRALFALRRVPARLSGTDAGKSNLCIDDLRSSRERPGFQILNDDPPREFTVGAIGKVWRLDIPFVHVDGEEAFARFAERDYVKVAWAIGIEPRGENDTRLYIELRVDATDDAAWRKFRRYFVIIGPGSRFIRHSVLAALARDVGVPSAGGEDRPPSGWTKLWKEIAASGVFPGRPPLELVTEAELAALPAVVQSYMGFCGVSASQPKDWAFGIGWRGRFRLAPNRPWMPIEAVQYDLRFPVARLFHMKARINGILPVLARDTYANGRGHMLAKVANLVTVADATGHEVDQSELVTWLNDCVLFAPSMLLGSATRWSQVNERAFDVSFSDHGCTVTARVSIDQRGAPVNFETTDRFLNDPDDPKHPLIRARWSTPIGSWQRIGSREYPARAKVTWHLASGEYTYAEFDLLPRALAIDVQPTTSGRFRLSPQFVAV